MNQEFDWDNREKPKIRLRIFNHNVGLVYNMAVKFMGYDVDYADLVQDGFIGLLKAIVKFDPERNIKFSTYACYWIFKHMQRAVYMSTTVKMPDALWEKFIRTIRIKQGKNISNGSCRICESSKATFFVKMSSLEELISKRQRSGDEQTKTLSDLIPSNENILEALTNG